MRAWLAVLFIAVYAIALGILVGVQLYGVAAFVFVMYFGIWMWILVGYDD